jgi:hypothetical protein
MQGSGKLMQRANMIYIHLGLFSRQNRVSF